MLCAACAHVPALDVTSGLCARALLAQTAPARAALGSWLSRRVRRVVSLLCLIVASTAHSLLFCAFLLGFCSTLRLCAFLFGSSSRAILFGFCSFAFLEALVRARTPLGRAGARAPALSEIGAGAIALSETGACPGVRA